MNGIYIHIPFCRQACRYCDFFFSVSLGYLDQLIERLADEIGMMAAEYGPGPIDTFYMGGGTPSILSEKHLDQLLGAMHRHFSFHSEAEWTIECNPDDLDERYFQVLNNLGFNRLSIGVQSFHEKDLQLMRRSHNAVQAVQSILGAASAGFSNISIDLIYGIPGQSGAAWEENLSRAIEMPVSHLSAYHLTFEPGTVFEHWRKKGRLVPVHEELSLHQYSVLRKKMEQAGFDHYEISNFALSGKKSRHNMIYWSGRAYLGIGPSAHSFDGTVRRWNIASLQKYMDGISQGKDISMSEILTRQERYHDYLITSLRTRWGADPEHIADQFGKTFHSHFQSHSQPFVNDGTMRIMGKRRAIHPDHWLITDHILRELFLD